MAVREAACFIELLAQVQQPMYLVWACNLIMIKHSLCCLSTSSYHSVMTMCTFSLIYIEISHSLYINHHCS